MALQAYKATAEAIFDRLVNVTIVCQIIKPLLKCKEFSWNHQAIFTLIRSASSIFLMQLLGEFYDLKSKLLESEENIIKDIEGRTIEEKTTNLSTGLCMMMFQINQKLSLLLTQKLWIQLKERNTKKK